jgi:hypothetical protein
LRLRRCFLLQEEVEEVEESRAVLAAEKVGGL